jgi:hypothetical protein
LKSYARYRSLGFPNLKRIPFVGKSNHRKIMVKYNNLDEIKKDICRLVSLLADKRYDLFLKELDTSEDEFNFILGYLSAAIPTHGTLDIYMYHGYGFFYSVCHILPEYEQVFYKYLSVDEVSDGKFEISFFLPLDNDYRGDISDLKMILNIFYTDQNDFKLRFKGVFST